MLLVFNTTQQFFSLIVIFYFSKYTKVVFNLQE